jgi:hypothetical protein
MSSRFVWQRQEIRSSSSSFRVKAGAVIAATRPPMTRSGIVNIKTIRLLGMCYLFVLFMPFLAYPVSAATPPAATDVARIDAFVREYLIGAIPFKPLAQPDDVTRAMLFYASDLSAFLTGTSLSLDGSVHHAIA